MRFRNRYVCLIHAAFFFSLSRSWTATHYVDATNGKDSNNGLSQAAAWETIAKINCSNFNPGAQISLKGGKLGEGNLSFLLQDNKANRLSVSLIHLSRPDTLLSYDLLSVFPMAYIAMSQVTIIEEQW